MAVPGVTVLLGLADRGMGTGLLKPNVSAMVGELYAPGDLRRDSGFSIFYMGINLGAALGPLVCGGLANRTGTTALGPRVSVCSPGSSSFG